MARYIAALVLAAVIGCASLTAEQIARREAVSTQICVGNFTAGMGNLYGGDVSMGGERGEFDVMGGRVECERFYPRASTFIDLRLQTIGGSLMGPTIVTARIPMEPGACWFWRVDNNTSSDRAMPCRPRDFDRLQK